MKNVGVGRSRIPRANRRAVCAALLAAATTVAAVSSARAANVTPPPVPPEIAVPAGNEAFLRGHAVGSQNYICQASGAGFAWTFFGPQATLFRDNGGQTMTHFLSANPDEDGTPRATWQHSTDTSRVWALAVASSSDPAFVAPGAIPWLLLRESGTEQGPTGGRKLTPTTYIHRLNTSGGVQPATGCAAAADVGKRAFVPYEADYFFYRTD